MTQVLEMPKFEHNDREPNEDEFTELVYDRGAAPIIFKHFPNANFSDASDDIHEGRFQVILNESDRDKFYVLMMLEGWTEDCLCFQLQLRTGQKLDQIRGWLNSAQKLKRAGYQPQ